MKYKCKLTYSHLLTQLKLWQRWLRLCMLLARQERASVKSGNTRAFLKVGKLKNNNQPTLKSYLIRQISVLQGHTL